MPLQLDYRPQNLTEFFGNPSIKESLPLAVSRGVHTFLFTGPSGCGKTTLARITADMLKCGKLDLYEYNISNMRGIDTARDIISNCKFEPLHGDAIVIVLNECHKATKEFQNAMLEILEEPPEKVYFILCTTDPEDLLPTIRNRATTFKVNTLTRHDMIPLIDWVLNSEGKTLTPKVKETILSASQGSPRIALKILDQIIDLPGEDNQIQAISEVTIDETLVIDLCRIIASRDSGAKRWEQLKPLLKGFDSEKDKAESARRAILGFLTVVLLNTKGEDGKRVALIIAEFVHPYYDSGKSGLITSCYMSTLI